MAYSVCKASVSTENVTIVDVKQIKQPKTEIRMFVIKKDVEDIDLCTMACFLDASFANLKDIILYKNKSFYPIAWKSRKIKRVVAEAIALEQALEACFMIKSFICVGMER